MGIAASMPGKRGVRSCRVQRTAVYQRRWSERAGGWLFRAASQVTCGEERVGVAQVLAGCCESCGLPMLFNGNCLIWA